MDIIGVLLVDIASVSGQGLGMLMDTGGLLVDGTDSLDLPSGSSAQLCPSLSQCLALQSLHRGLSFIYNSKK